MTTIWTLVIFFTATPGAFVHEVPTASKAACEVVMNEYITPDRPPGGHYGRPSKGLWDAGRLSAICVEKLINAGPAT